MSSIAPETTISSTSSSPAAASSTTSSSSTGLTSSASLYLYTFLATLILLLGVSSAIVIRSLILRRRHRRLVEESIRNGTWAPITVNERRRRRGAFGEKPKMWEVHVPTGGDVDKHFMTDDNASVQNEKLPWSNISPLSATYVGHPSAPSGSQQPPTFSPGEEPPVNRVSRFLRPFQRRGDRQLPSPYIASSQPMPAPSIAPSTPLNQDNILRVAVVISMPSQPHQPTSGEAEGNFIVELGLVDVPVRRPGTDRTEGAPLFTSPLSRVTSRRGSTTR